METIKQLYGYSNTHVEVVKSDSEVFVRKYGDVNRNVNQLVELTRNGLPCVEVINVTCDYYDMAYIPNLDIKTYLIHNPANKLIEFLESCFDTFIRTSTMFDYSEVYNNKLKDVCFDGLPFTRDELMRELPKAVPRSLYHGDFTLDNILYDINKKSFVLIDPLTTEYDSYAFDIAKLKQDLTCKWFIRTSDVMLDSKLQQISKRLSSYPYFNDHSLLVLMLLRVLPYAKNEFDKKYLIDEMRKLWK